MRTVALVVLIAGVPSCATPGERTAIGAGGGAVVGAGIGGLAGGWEGAAIGALVGGVAGGAIGIYLDKQAQERAGAGASRPIADNSTPEGRAQNRRVELYIDVPQRS